MQDLSNKVSGLKAIIQGCKTISILFNQCFYGCFSLNNEAKKTYRSGRKNEAPDNTSGLFEKNTNILQCGQDMRRYK